MRFVILFFGQGLNFLIAITNIRAAAKGKLWTTVGSDFLFSVVNFYLITRIAQARDGYELLAYALGGAAGSGLAIRLTRKWDQP